MSTSLWRDRPILITGATGLVGRPDIRDEASNEIRHQYLSAERSRTQLGWRPLFTLDEGLTRTIAWYRDFLDNSYDGREFAKLHLRDRQQVPVRTNSRSQNVP